MPRPAVIDAMLQFSVFTHILTQLDLLSLQRPSVFYSPNAFQPLFALLRQSLFQIALRRGIAGGHFQAHDERICTINIEPLARLILLFVGSTCV